MFFLKNLVFSGECLPNFIHLKFVIHFLLSVCKLKVQYLIN